MHAIIVFINSMCNDVSKSVSLMQIFFMLLYHVISLTGVFAVMQHRQKVLILQMRMLLEIGLQDLEQKSYNE